MHAHDRGPSRAAQHQRQQREQALQAGISVQTHELHHAPHSRLLTLPFSMILQPYANEILDNSAYCAPHSAAYSSLIEQQGLSREQSHRHKRNSNVTWNCISSSRNLDIAAIIVRLHHL